MIISIRPIPFLYQAGTRLDSVTPISVTGVASGEVIYPGGGLIRVPHRQQIIQIIQDIGTGIVERYCITDTNTPPIAPPVQLLLRITPRTPLEPVEVLLDRRGIAEAHKYYGYADECAKGVPIFLNSIIYSCVRQELLDINPYWDELLCGWSRRLNSSKIKTPLVDKVRWACFKDINRSSSIWATNSYNPENIAMSLEEQLQAEHRNGLAGGGFAIQDLEDMFLPRLAPLTVDTLTAMGWKYRGLPWADLKVRLNPTKLDLGHWDQEAPLEHQIPPLSPTMMELVSAGQHLRYTDWDLTYISHIRHDPQFGPQPMFDLHQKVLFDRFGVVSSDLTAVDAITQHHLPCIGRILDELYPQAKQVRIFKTFNNWLYLEVTDQHDQMVRYGLDLTILAMVSHDLTYNEQ